MQKRILITGGNTGIGLATAKQLTAAGHEVILACRDQTKGQAALGTLRKQAPDVPVSVVPLDLASLQQVRDCAAEVRERFDHIDVLINNAGVVPTRQQFTQEGYEMQFGVNYLGHVLLTHLLLERLQAAPQGRIVHLSSVAHWLGRINEKTWRGRSPYLVMDAYGQSKLANLMFSNELARRLDPASVTSNALHPGGVDTGIFRHVPRPAYNLLLKPALTTPENAARLPVSLALDEQYLGVTGQYLVNHRPARTKPAARRRDVTGPLYERSCELLDLSPLPLR